MEHGKDVTSVHLEKSYEIYAYTNDKSSTFHKWMIYKNAKEKELYISQKAFHYKLNPNFSLWGVILVNTITNSEQRTKTTKK